MNRDSRASGVKKTGGNRPMMKSEEMPRGQREGSELRKDTQDNRDSVDSDQTPDATRLDDDVNSKGNVDEASNYMVYLHDKQKQTPIFTPLSPPRTGSSRDDISHYLNENPTPSCGDFYDNCLAVICRVLCSSDVVYESERTFWERIMFVRVRIKCVVGNSRRVGPMTVG
nr:hypothetical protein [Tanacetum cinerariifolium]